MGSDETCTAATSGGDEPNVLMTPPCTCSVCRAKEPTGETAPPDGVGWLRVSGHRQRRRVQSFDLGRVGQMVLG